MREFLKWGQSPRWRVVSVLGLLAVWMGGPGVPWAAAGEGKEEPLFRQIPHVQDTLKDADPFFRDTDLNVHLRTLPLSHVFGQMMGMLIPQLLGGEVHFHDSLVPARMIETILENRISVLATVPRIIVC